MREYTRSDLIKLLFNGGVEEAEKWADFLLKATKCPGGKIKSKGKGRGLGRGKKKGPIGIPFGRK